MRCAFLMNLIMCMSYTLCTRANPNENFGVAGPFVVGALRSAALLHLCDNGVLRSAVAATAEAVCVDRRAHAGHENRPNRRSARPSGLMSPFITRTIATPPMNSISAAIMPSAPSTKRLAHPKGSVLARFAAASRDLLGHLGLLLHDVQLSASVPTWGHRAQRSQPPAA